MKNNNNQKDLRGIDCVMKKFSFSEVLNELCAKYGQGALADEIGMDPAALSRFKNGEGTISLKKIEALLSFSDMSLIATDDIKNLYISFFTMSDLLKKAVNL